MCVCEFGIVMYGLWLGVVCLGFCLKVGDCLFVICLSIVNDDVL